MGADATHRPCPPDGQAGVDVLVGADDDAHRRPAVLVAVVVAALLAGVVAVDPWPEPQAPVLALREGVLVPRDRTVDERLAEARMHVEVVNVGDHALDVRSASLVPGAWEVDVVDRPRVRPGQSLVLALHRTVVCDERASYGPAPEHLVVEARAHGQAVVVRLPVVDPAAYGDRLDDALRHPGRACVATGRATGGPIGDIIDTWRQWPTVVSR